MERKSEIAVICNKYKNTLDDLNDSLDINLLDQLKSLDWIELIDKETYNIFNSKSTSPGFLEEDCLDKNILVMLLELAPKIWDIQIYKCHDIAPFGPKSRRV